MRKTVRRATLLLALTPLVSVPATSALAAGAGHGGSTTTISTPAPPGDASAVAAEVDGIVAAGKTTAHAGSGGGSASADGLDLLGQRVSGGDQKGTGSKAGNLVGTGQTPAGDAEVAPWSAAVTDKDGGYQSAAEAALAHADLGGLVEIWLLHSTSAATWSPSTSTGDAASDGAEVSALDMLDVKVLHSEAHSTGKGHSDLLVVNDNEIGSSDQANGACKLEADPLVSLICLTANGGTGKDGVTSASGTVASFVAGGGALTGTVSGSSSAGGVAGTAPALGAGNSPGEQSGNKESGAQVPSAPAAGPALPFTGADSRRLATTALGLLMLGVATTAFGRRRRLGGLAVSRVGCA